MPSLTLVVALVPLIVAASSVGLWRTMVGRPLVFGLVAVVVTYVLMGIALVYAAQGVGIAARSPSEPVTFGPLERRLTVALVIYVAVSLAALYGLALALRKG